MDCFEGRKLVGWRGKVDWEHKNRILSEIFRPSSIDKAVFSQRGCASPNLVQELAR